ncbi:GNAT family N-acetyltransferase [Aspergillus lucknowensis]|uniref:Acyl-CoA N-acyltransferase n=1 Tax=Aspergillus lucknowensis TaxID=176173 RepID=A0ABR4LWR0_9EURO
MPIIRPATTNDLAQVRAINTHYILNTVLTFAQNPPPESAYIAKFGDITGRGLPYLVAVDETANFQDANDLVLGYTYLSPFRGNMLSYAPTVELSLFIHPDHQDKGLGSRLLGAILDAAREARHLGFELTHSTRVEGSKTQENGDGDENQVEKRTYAVDPDDGGSGARVKNILAVMAVNPEGLDGGEALRRWYIKRGFVERGRMQRIGFKKGNW